MHFYLKVKYEAVGEGVKEGLKGKWSSVSSGR